MSDDLLARLQPELSAAAAPFDPRDPAHQSAVTALVDRLLAGEPTPADLAALERDLIEQQDVPLSVNLAIKLARSRTIVRALDGPLHVSVVFAMYKEHTRLVRPEEHPHGEDFLARKIEQLGWLFADHPDLTWELIAVDDGCPESSGSLARRILAERFADAPARVLFLEEAIAQGVTVTRPMTATAESQKGGSVVYGMAEAVAQEHARHVVVFTDADLSTHLGQVGLLIDGMVNQGADAAIGSRREPTSVVIKQGHRNTRGKLFIYLWKGLIAPLSAVVDTQCGFKAFTAEVLRDILPDLIEKRFAFDIELLLRTELRRAGSIVKVPVAWIDSEAASTTTSLQPYLPMLQKVAAMYRHYLPTEPGAAVLADFLDGLTPAQWLYLSEHVPEAIAQRDPAEFDRFREVTVADLERVLSRDAGPS